MIWFVVGSRPLAKANSSSGGSSGNGSGRRSKGEFSLGVCRRRRILGGYDRSRNRLLGSYIAKIETIKTCEGTGVHV